jgi:hypothetical protein
VLVHLLDLSSSLVFLPELSLLLIGGRGYMRIFVRLGPEYGLGASGLSPRDMREIFLSF